MPKLGLALSGGGFRATLFHLGVVRFLRDAGALRDVTDIASVSGGSILAAHLVLNWDKYNGDEQSFAEVAAQIVKLVQFDVRNHIVRRLPLLYVLGYSAGGDGVYQLAPRLADRWAAAGMMAGNPNDASPLNLRNLGFALHVGGTADCLPVGNLRCFQRDVHRITFLQAADGDFDVLLARPRNQEFLRLRITVEPQ